MILWTCSADGSTADAFALKMRITALGLLQADIADEVNIDQPKLSDLLNGRRPLPPDKRDLIEAAITKLSAKRNVVAR